MEKSNLIVQNSCGQIPGKFGFQVAKMTKLAELAETSPPGPPPGLCPGPAGRLVAPPDPQLGFYPTNINFIPTDLPLL